MKHEINLSGDEIIEKALIAYYLGYKRYVEQNYIDYRDDLTNYYDEGILVNVYLSKDSAYFEIKDGCYNNVKLVC